MKRISESEEDKLKRNIQLRFKKILSTTIDNPVLNACYTWKVLSEQIQFILGDEIHRQWFENIKPLLLKNSVLILQTENLFAAQWINTHYHALVDGLIKAQDKSLSCFFIAPTKASTRKRRF